MKFVIDRKELKEMVASAAKGTSEKSTLEAHKCLLMKAGDGKLIVIGNSNDLTIKTGSSAMVFDEGNVAVNAKQLESIMTRLPVSATDVTMEVDTMPERNGMEIKEGNMKLTAGKVKMNIPVMPVDDVDFVDFSEKIDASNIVKMKASVFTEGFKNTRYACGLQNMNWMRIHIEDGFMEFIALDGHRIALEKRKIEDTVDITIDSYINIDILKRASGAFQPDEEMEISLTGVKKNRLWLRFGNTEVVMATCEGRNFNVHSMIPQNATDISLTAKKEEIIGLCERAKLFSTVAEKKPLIFQFENGKASATVKAVRGGLHEEVEAEVQGELLIGVNPYFLPEALNAVDTEEITLEFTSKVAPIILRGESEGTEYVHLLLPINVQNV